MNVLVVNIDSRLRNRVTYPDASFFQTDIPNCVKDVVSIRLASMEYPNVNPLIQPNRQNNVFMINTTKYTIPQGSYSAYQLVVGINQLLTSNDVSVSNVDYTGQIVFSSKTNTTFTLTFPKGEKGYPTLGSILGFGNVVYKGASSYTAEKTINVAADSYLFLRVNDFGSVISPGIDMKPAFAKIILTSGVFTMVMDNGSNLMTRVHECDLPMTIFRLTIEILDYLGNRMAVSSDYSLTLEITYLNNSLLKEERLLWGPEGQNTMATPIGSVLFTEEEETADRVAAEEEKLPFYHDPQKN